MTVPNPILMPIPAALRAPLLICVTALTVAATLAIASSQLRRTADDTRNDLILRLNGIHRQHEEALKEAADARLALRQHAELDRLGLKPPVPRLQMSEGIDAALAEAGLPDLHYTLSPPQRLGSTPLLSLSTVQLDGNIPHEARLLTLFNRLDATRNGLFLPLRCTLARTATDAHTIVKAACEATWLGLQASI